MVSTKRDTPPLEVAAAVSGAQTSGRNSTSAVDAPTPSVVSKAKARKNKRDKDRGNAQSREKAAEANAAPVVKNIMSAQSRVAQQDRVPAVRSPGKMEGAAEAVPQATGAGTTSKRKAGSATSTNNATNAAGKHGILPTITTGQYLWPWHRSSVFVQAWGTSSNINSFDQYLSLV